MRKLWPECPLIPTNRKRMGCLVGLLHVKECVPAHVCRDPWMHIPAPSNLYFIVDKAPPRPALSCQPAGAQGHQRGAEPEACGKQLRQRRGSGGRCCRCRRPSTTGTPSACGPSKTPSAASSPTGWPSAAAGRPRCLPPRPPHSHPSLGSFAAPLSLAPRLRLRPPPPRAPLGGGRFESCGAGERGEGGAGG